MSRSPLAFCHTPTITSPKRLAQLLRDRSPADPPPAPTTPPPGIVWWQPATPAKALRRLAVILGVERR